MQLCDVFYDREAEAGPAEFAAATFVGAIEALKNTRQIGSTNPDALIRYADADTIPGNRRPQRDCAARLRIFHRVIEQIINDLLETALVRRQGRQISRK